LVILELYNLKPKKSSKIKVADVDNNKWYAKAVQTVLENKIFSQDKKANFRPDSKITRAELFVAVAKLKDIKAVYFIGAGGIGMSAIARYFMKRGLVVAGYDKTPETYPLFTAEQIGDAVKYVITAQCNVREIALLPYGQFPHLGA